MKTKAVLSLADADRIIELSIRHALARSWPVCIAICDDGGHLLRLSRLDGATPLSASIAVSKSVAAALSRKPTKSFEDSINQGRTALVTAPLDGLMEGGIPIVIDGAVIGAVGVSGVRPEQDAEVATAGLAGAA